MTGAGLPSPTLPDERLGRVAGEIVFLIGLILNILFMGLVVVTLVMLVRYLHRELKTPRPRHPAEPADPVRESVSSDPQDQPGLTWRPEPEVQPGAADGVGSVEEGVGLPRVVPPGRLKAPFDTDLR